MASSSGYGASTSGDRRAMQPQYWIDTVVLNYNANEKELEVRKLFTAVINLDIAAARKAAEKLKAMGTGVDAAVEAVVDPRSERLGPLHAAVETRYLEMCKMLVRKCDCDPNVASADGKTPLFPAMLGKGSLAIVKYLISSGADPNKADNRGITPLHIAAGQGHCEIAEYLFSKGANVDPISQEGEAPLHIAARRGMPEMVKLLLRHSAEFNRLSNELYTPLVESLFGSSLECLEEFIKVGANINTGSHVTPLSVAARKGLADCIKCLLNNGANPNEPDEDGKLPIEIAASRGWQGCVEILLPVTNPLEKFANLSIAQMLQEEAAACQHEALATVVDGDVAYWEGNYAQASRCYTKAFRLGHSDPVLYAKRGLCHLRNHDHRGFLDDAYCYMDHITPDLSVPCTEKAAKKLVLEYGKYWKEQRLGSGSNPTDETDQASREEHHP